MRVARRAVFEEILVEADRAHGDGAAIGSHGAAGAGGQAIESLQSIRSWTLHPPIAGRFVVWCRVAPDRSVGGVVFRLELRPREGGVVARQRRVRLDAAHVGWTHLSVPLPQGSRGCAVTVSAAADTGGAIGPLYARAVLRRRRSLRELRHLTRAVVRTYGLTGAARRAMQRDTERDAGAAYIRWVSAHTPSADSLRALADRVEALGFRPTISVLTPVFNTDPEVLDLCIRSVLGQAYTRWELCLVDDGSTRAATREVLARYAGHPAIRVDQRPCTGGIVAATNAALARARGEFVALLDHDDELAPEALAEIVAALNATPDADLLYTDEDKLGPGGVRCEPFMKPDWSPEYLESCMYTCHLTVIRRSIVEAVGGCRDGFDGAQDYDLTLRVAERARTIVHVPHVLYHWRKMPGSTASDPFAKPEALEAARRALADHMSRTGLDGSVEPGLAPGLWRIRRTIRGEPLVTIVVPTDGRRAVMRGGATDLLANCLRSIRDRTTYARYEVLVVDNGVLGVEARAVLQSMRHRRVTYRYEPPFNFSHKLNASVAHAHGDHVVIMNDDIEVIEPGWLTSLLEYSQEPAIGAVGARLLYPDGRLQHVGVATGVCGVAAHLYHQHPGATAGMGAAVLAARNYSAVTGACLMTRRAVFEQVGGFNERLRIDFNDVDYCLRVQAAGYRVVYTPYAVLYHHESGSFGPRQQQSPEIDEMRRTWGPRLAADPYYNPNLTREFPDCRPGA